MKSKPDPLNILLTAAVSNRVSESIAAAVGTLSTNRPRFLSMANCSADTIFDLASLTKVLSTTLIAAEAISLGKLSLDERPFPNWPNVRILDLMQHTSGLPAWQNFYSKNLNRSEMFERVLATQPVGVPGAQTVYSDIGFIALGYLLELRLKDRLDVIFSDLSLKHYGPNSLSYFPTNKRQVNKTAIKPTGFCPVRQRKLQGQVNDLNAYGLEGIAGHAGLFGTINDVEIASCFFLTSLKAPLNSMQRLIRAFATAEGVRPIGFDRAERNGSTGGVLSTQTVGHLGFTGTSMWFDPESLNNDGAYFILLTNHLEISPRKLELAQLRRDFHRAGMRWISPART